MRLFVTGGGGYVGAHVVRDLVAAGHHVAVFDNFSTGTRVNLPAGVRIEEGDLLDYSRLLPLVKEGWDGVLHFAGLKAVGESMVAPERYSFVNVNGGINLLNAMSEARIGRIVFSSTSAIFDDKAPVPLTEHSQEGPSNYYGFTKLLFEEVLSWYDRLRGISYVSLRYFNAAGYAAEIEERETKCANLIPIVMETACGWRQSVPIYGDDYPTPDGTCVRDYVHVRDLSEAHILGLLYLEKGGASRCLNLGSEHETSVQEVLTVARQITGRAIPSVVVPRREGDPVRRVASSQEARRLLGWKPRHSTIEEIVESTWEIYKRGERCSPRGVS